MLAQALNLYVGGTCIEDIANLQQSEAVLRLVGACRIPEWKRFRQAFVVVPAQVLRKAAQIWLRVSGSHRFVEEFLGAQVRLHR